MSRRLSYLRGLPFSCALVSGAAFLGAAFLGAAGASALDVTLVTPSGMETVFGRVEVKADVFLEPGETVDEVILFVDGKARGRLTTPPWQWTVDVGDENREHAFRVEARGPAGRKSSLVKTPAIRVDEEVAVELQQLYVTVTRDGSRVLDLDESAFRILDDGRSEDLVTFARGDVSLTAVLLLDSSESMRGDRLRAALQGSRSFVDGMKGNDEAMVMLFSDQLLRSTPFTQDGEVLHASFEGARASGNTAVNDHLYLGLKLLDARQGRRVVVLFTDGADLHSVLDMDEVLWKARRSQALIYWLRLDDGGDRYRSFSTAWRDADGNRHELEALEKTVRQSGGRITELQSLDQVDGAFRDILAELREQYVLGYYPSKVENDGAWHEVEVQVPGRRELKIRARDGYVDF